MAQEVDLKDIVLSAAAKQAWNEAMKRVEQGVKTIGRMRDRKFKVSKRRARLKDDGTLTLFVSVPPIIPEATLDVPADQWAWRRVRPEDN